MTAPAMPNLELEWLSGRYAVCRLDAQAPIPTWAVDASSGAASAPQLWCVSRTEKELSIVIDEAALPADWVIAAPVQRGFVAMRIMGTLDFALVGVLARLTAALAAANVSVFVISTYDTDVILVREADRKRAEAAVLEIARIATRLR